MKRRRKRLMVIIPVAAVCVAGAGTVGYFKDEDAFSIVDQSEIMESMSGVTNTMSLMIRTNRVFLSGNPHIDKV